MRIHLQRGFSSFLPLCGVYNVVISVVSWGQALPGGMRGDRGSQLSVYFNVVPNMLGYMCRKILEAQLFVN